MRYRFLYFILFFVVNGLVPAHAQVFSWREPGKSTCYKIDFPANKLLESDSKGQYQVLGDINLVDVKMHDLYSTAEAINPMKIKGRPGTFLVMECSGQVYYFDLPSKTLTRDDLTFYRGANCQAVQFVRKDTLYSFGGYGFWQTTNIMTQYNFVAKEWTHILAKGTIPASIHKLTSIFLPDIDRFIALGSQRINQTESSEAMYDNSIYDYQFDQKKFNKLGEVYEPILKSLMGVEKNNFLLSMGRYILISPNRDIHGYNHDLLYIIDVKDSFKGYLWLNPARFQIRKFIEDRGILYSSFTNSKAVFFPQLIEKYPIGTYKLVEVPINTLLAESEYLGPIMEKPWTDRLQEVGILFVLFMVVMLGARFVYQRKRKKKSRQIAELLEENEKLFLEFMTLNYPKGYVSGHQIIAFFGKHKSSPESQRQFRAKLIDGFTKGLGVIFPGIEVLDIRADQQDQRMLTYRLTETIYQELKKL